MKTVRILDEAVYTQLAARAEADRRTLQDYVNLVLAEHCRMLPAGSARAGDLAATAYRPTVFTPIPKTFSKR